jgi:hypothetical protein
MTPELIRITTADGCKHFGAYYPCQTQSALGVVLIHGMTGSFVGELESALPPLLTAAGLPVLVANNRGNGLLGAANETVAGVLPDVAAALGAMQVRGFERIVLLGHSKGGIKVSYYLTQTGDPRVVALGLLSPAASFHVLPTWLAAQFGKKDPQRWLKKVFKQAAKGNGGHIYVDEAWPYLISAGTLSDHAAACLDDVGEHVTQLALPILAVCGSLELDWCTVVANLLSNAPGHVRAAVIGGADHVYTSKEQDLADLLTDWIRGL